MLAVGGEDWRNGFGCSANGCSPKPLAAALTAFICSGVVGDAGDVVLGGATCCAESDTALFGGAVLAAASNNVPVSFVIA